MIGRTVVSNSGPLMALAKLNRLSLLKKLFQQVSITVTSSKNCSRKSWTGGRLRVFN